MNLPAPPLRKKGRSSIEQVIEHLVNAAIADACARQLITLPTVWDAGDEPITVILVPSYEWTMPVAENFEARTAKVWTAPRKGKAQGDTDMALRLDPINVWVADAATAIPDAVTIVADRTLIIDGLTNHAIAKVITALTGEVTDIVEEDWRGLGLYAVANALAAAHSAQDCRARLQRYSQRAMHRSATASAPHREMPLAGAPAAWFEETRAIFTGIKAGTIEPGRLRNSLLWGSPGTGKSAIVRQLAHAAQVPLHVISIGQVFAETDGYLNTVVRAVRSFFDRLLAETGPAIGLIEEIDAVSTRDRRGGVNDQYWTTLITTILLSIDDLNARQSPILLAGCTNRPEDVDPAVRRPGRIGHLVEMTAPRSVAAVKAVLRYHLNTDLTDADLTEVAANLVGESHAGLADRVVAARNRASLEQRQVRLADLLPPGSTLTSIDLEHLRQVAIHEAAHAVVASVLGRSVQALHLRNLDTIAGLTWIKPPRAGQTLAERLDAVTIAMAGRAADWLISNRVCDGSATDLAHATRELAELHWASGLMDTPVVLSSRQLDALMVHDHELNRLIHKRLMDQADIAERLVTRHRDAIEHLADRLLENRSLDAEDLAPILQELRP